MFHVYFSTCARALSSYMFYLIKHLPHIMCYNLRGINLLIDFKLGHSQCVEVKTPRPWRGQYNGFLIWVYETVLLMRDAGEGQALHGNRQSLQGPLSAQFPPSIPPYSFTHGVMQSWCWRGGGGRTQIGLPCNNQDICIDTAC